MGPLLAVLTADEPPRFEVGASLGYAAPIGSAEAGARMSDTTIGLVPIDVDGAYRLTRAFAIAVTFRYGVGIPTLCQTAGECLSSLGRDVAVTLRARFFLPTLGPLHPYAEGGVGYEWFATSLADSGARSTRSYGGPLLLVAGVIAPFELSSTWTLGPALDLALGTFTRAGLEAGGLAVDRSIEQHAIHAWLSAAGRLSARF